MKKIDKLSDLFFSKQPFWYFNDVVIVIYLFISQIIYMFNTFVMVPNTIFMNLNITDLTKYIIHFYTSIYYSKIIKTK